MVYSPNKVVACLKVDGKVLREDGNAVTLPFGSEYSVLIKNLNPVRIKVRVSVDGTDATEGLWLIVNPNDDLELERFIRNGNLQAGNRFKFIERTSDIEAFRGIKADDGLIRIEYQVEKRTTVLDEVITRKHYVDEYIDWPRYPRRHPWETPVRFSGNLGGNRLKSSMRPSASAGRSLGASARRLTKSAETLDFNSVESDSVNCSASLSDQGITVPGSESNQKFTLTSGFETGPSEVIVLQLRGAIAGKKAVKAVTVEMKPKCSTCGKVNKGVDKFCSKCGTALILV
jgi:hypothetical protein